MEWPASTIFDIWAEFSWRWCEELRQVRRDLLRSMKDPSPSMEAFKWTALAPGEDGEPWLFLPRTFRETDGYFQLDVLPGQRRRPRLRPRPRPRPCSRPRPFPNVKNQKHNVLKASLANFGPLGVVIV